MDVLFLGSLFLEKALPQLGELIILPSLLGESCPPVPWGKRDTDLGVASECYVVSECNVAEIHKGVDGKLFGNKGAVVRGLCRNLFLPGEGVQEALTLL